MPRKTGQSRIQYGLFLVFLYGIAYQSAWAQSTRQDSLRRDSLKHVLFDPKTLPAERVKARNELLGTGPFNVPDAGPPQAIVLRESMHWVRQNHQKEDSIVSKMIDIVLHDSLAGIDHKKQALKVLATSGSPRAYAFLIGHMDMQIYEIGDYDNSEFFHKATFKYLSEIADNNWALFPLIIQYLTVQKVKDSDIIPLTLILEQIAGGHLPLLSLINCYEVELNNEIFKENRKNIIQTLIDLH